MGGSGSELKNCALQGLVKSRCLVRGEEMLAGPSGDTAGGEMSFGEEGKAKDL